MLPVFLIIISFFFLACPDIGFDNEEWIDPSIFTIDIDGNNEERLTKNDNFFRYPSYADNGRKIVFGGWGDNKGESVFIMDADGNNRTWLANGMNPVVSPNGRKILFYTTGNPIIVNDIEYYSSGDIVVMNLDGSDQNNLTFSVSDTFVENYRMARFSPDGEKIVYFYERLIGWVPIEQAIYTMNIDGSEKTKRFDVISNNPYPVFTPDGNGIVFLKGGWGYEGWEDQTISVYDITTDTINDLTVAYECDGLDVSPDGSSIVYETKSGLNKEIFTIDVDGTNRRRITNDSSGDNYNPSFSPDGTKIVFLGEDEDGYLSDIFIISSDGSGLKNLTENTSRYHNDPHFSPDSRTVVFSAESQ